MRAPCALFAVSTFEARGSSERRLPGWSTQRLTTLLDARKVCVRRGHPGYDSPPEIAGRRADVSRQGRFFRNDRPAHPLFSSPLSCRRGGFELVGAPKLDFLDPAFSSFRLDTAPVPGAVAKSHDGASLVRRKSDRSWIRVSVDGALRCGDRRSFACEHSTMDPDLVTLRVAYFAPFLALANNDNRQSDPFVRPGHGIIEARAGSAVDPVVPQA